MNFQGKVGWCWSIEVTQKLNYKMKFWNCKMWFWKRVDQFYQVFQLLDFMDLILV